MKTFSNRFTLIAGFITLFSSNLLGQSSYQSSNYASIGDSVFLTSAQTGSTDFSITGPNVIWDYSGLVGTGQRLLEFRAPNQTGFSPAQWPYIQNLSNVNLSSTDQASVSVGTFQYSEPNDYFLLSANDLRQKAVSSKLTINNTSFSLKTVYSTPDVVFRFPMTYGNPQDSSLAFYVSSIPNVYYKETELKRKNTLDSWGILTTPYGTFTDCIRLNSEIVRIDSMSVDTIGFAKDTSVYRELYWFHPSIEFPLLTVRENLVNGVYITSSIEYYDDQQFFQPNAMFAYLPVLPQVGDTVSFQNISTNSTSYAWKFNDSASAADTSFLINPDHVFSLAGTYTVRLIAWNGSLSDTIIIPVTVADTVLPVASFSWLENPAFIGDSIHFQSTSQNVAQFDWDFGDSSSGSLNNALIANPAHVFNQVGVYQIQLIVSNSIGSDTLVQLLTVSDSVHPIASFTWLPDTIYESDTVIFQNLSTFAFDFVWDFGDSLSGMNNTSFLTAPIHVYDNPGVYLVQLIAMNASFSDTLTDEVIVLPKSTALLNENEMLEVITVYPNPADNHIYLNKISGEQTFTVKLFNSIGESCLEYFVNGASAIDVSSLEPGVYTLIALINEQLVRVKFMKK